MQGMTPRRVVMVAMPCREVVEIGGALDIFYAANVRLPTGRGYAVEVVSPVATVCGWAGLRLASDRSYRSVRGDIDTLIVTGIDEPDDARRDPDLIRWLARVGPRTRRVVGLCTGTFVLAEAGLLDGRSATTHWMDCDELARRFPAVTVQRDPIYVRDRGIYTSAGSTAGLDLVLALVEEDVGRRVALQVAQRMVFFLKRPGGQAQFSAGLALAGSDGSFDDLHDWMKRNLRGDLAVPALAGQAGMSERSFLRHYRQVIGVTPARAVERMRVEAARQALGETSAPLKRIARDCGFGSEETMRRSFLRILAVPPHAYRERFPV
jgi:transcriptional regulator GlxA family with amidase domain